MQLNDKMKSINKFT